MTVKLPKALTLDDIANTFQKEPQEVALQYLVLEKQLSEKIQDETSIRTFAYGGLIVNLYTKAVDEMDEDDDNE